MVKNLTKMKLGNLIHLRTGLVLNRKQVTTQEDRIEYTQLTLKCIMPIGLIDRNELEIFYAKEQLKQEYFTQINDVVVRLSYPYTAVLIDDATQGLLVPSHFAIIRCDGAKLNAGYLQWILNSSNIRNKISRSTSTSGLGTIRTTFFTDLEIDIPTLREQVLLADVNQLAQREIILMEQLKEQKQKYYSALTNKIQKEMRKRK